LRFCIPVSGALCAVLSGFLGAEEYARKNISSRSVEDATKTNQARYYSLEEINSFFTSRYVDAFASLQLANVPLQRECSFKKRDKELEILRVTVFPRGNNGK